MPNLLDYTFSVEDILRLIPIAFAIVLASRTLMVKSVFSKSKYFLAFLFVLLAIIQLELFIYNMGLKSIARHLVVFFVPAIMALLPVNYLFLKSLSCNITGCANKKSWMHLVLPAMVFFLLSLFYSLHLLFPKNSDTSLLYYSFFWWVIDICIQYLYIAQTLIYLILIALLLRSHKKTIANVYSYQENINLRWTTWIVVGYIVFSISIVLTELTTLGDFRLAEDILILAYLFFIQHFALKQMSINKGLPISVREEEESSTLIDNHEKHKYENSALKDEEKIKNIISLLDEYIEKEKPFLDPQLSIHKVSESINVNSKYLSQVINQALDSNFITFINKYRVEEVKRLLMDDSNNNYTVEALGQMAGFNSKTTFYKAFKKLSGQTPAEYKESINIK